MWVFFPSSVILLALALGSSRAGDPFERPKALPETVLPGDAPGIRDLTPKEFEQPEEVIETISPRKSGGIYGSAEFLLMRPSQHGLDYALVDPLDNLAPQGRLQSVNYNTRPGFRIGIGYRVPDSNWEIGFLYTYLHSTGTGVSIAPAGGLLYPETTRPGLTDSALTAVAHARLTYNVYDLEFGRTLPIDEWMQFRLFSGIRFATIQQTLQASFNGRLADNAFTENRSNFNGAGPIFGGEMRWKLGRGFSVFGRMTGGLIYGNVRSALMESNNGGATVYTNIGDRQRQIVPVAGIGLGIAWEYRGLTFRAGYEAVNWFSLIERPAFVDSFSEGKLFPRQSDLSIDGFFLQLGYSF